MGKFLRKRLELLKYAGIIIAGSIYIWVITILLENDNWVGISALSTMILAIAAFWAIRNSREQEKRDKDERLLNEIIEWALNFTKRPSEKVFRDIAGAAGTEKVPLYVHAHIVEVMESFVGMSGKNLYISRIALKFEQGLQKAVEELIKDLDAYVKCLGQWQHELSNAIVRNIPDKEENTIKADEHVRRLEKSAHKVAEEATKIKTKDIG